LKNKKTLKPIKRPARISMLSFLADKQGCGTLRIMLPYMLLNHYREKDIIIDTTYLTNYVVDSEYYKNFTFCVFQRSATKEHLQLIQHFKNSVQKKFPIPLVYEIDDQILEGKTGTCIPEWNYASVYYNKNQDVIKKIMSLCDAMTVSTAKLKELYSPYCKNITVVKNRLPKFIWGDVYPKHLYYKPEDKVKILWGGSQNHFAMKQIMGEDGPKGGDFGNELIDFIKKTTDKYEWYFMGAMPDELQCIKDKIKFHTWFNIFEFPKALKDIEPDIMLAPLQDIEFNHSKSSIKALEATAVGAVGIYSDVTPYKNLTTKAKTDEEFIYHIERLANDVDLRAKTYNKDYRIIKPDLFWEENNNLKKFLNSYLGLFGQKL
jgi:hypothetical protein